MNETYGAADHDDHVRLLAGHDSRGSPVTEMIPAVRLFERRWRLLASPVLAEGCASGDEVEVQVDGAFEIVSREGNLTVLDFAAEGEDLHEAAATLREMLQPMNGQVEVVPDGRAMVATISAGHGFQTIEAEIQRWGQLCGRLNWCYGNIYDEDDRPLNWWV